MKPKDFFPNLPDQPFEDLKEALMHIDVSVDRTENLDEVVKKKEGTFFVKIPCSSANKVKKMVRKSAEEACAQFAIEKREDDWNVLYGLIDAYGHKHALPKFLEYLNSEADAIVEFKNKYFPEKNS